MNSRSVNGDTVGSSTAASTAGSPHSQWMENISSLQKMFLQREALMDACTLPLNATTSLQTRRQTTRECAEKILKLFDELRITTPGTAGSTLDVGAASGGAKALDERGKQKNDNELPWMARAVAEASSGFFHSECGLEVDVKELRVPDEDVSAGSEKADRRLQPLQVMLAGIKELRGTPQYNQLLSSSNKGNLEVSAIPSLVKELQDAVEECLRALRDGYANCANSLDDISVWSDWLRPLVHLVSECLRITPLERVTEEPRERLRRVSFDVKEKQREQEDAVSDGDMVRSEQLYFEKIALLESMQPLYDQLERAIEECKHKCAEEPSKQVRMHAQELTAHQAPPLVAKEQHLKKRGYGDLERISARRDEVRAARNAQRAGYSVYLIEWEKLFELNQQQQDSCLRAMEDLERRLKHLSEERTFLVEDRLEAVTQEWRREEDALGFMAFAARQEQLLRTTLRYVEQSLFCSQNIHDAVRNGYQQVSRYLHDAVEQTADAQLLAARKERLEHFRGLYLTLGELQFKKERHLEELDKRIDYYHVQQELAMDTFNPKAKEYSKARKDLLDVKQTMEEQLQLIAQKAQQQLEEFKPTEKLLRALGVEFRHPVDDLTEMNARRKQKLLEYHSLMSTVNGDQADGIVAREAEGGETK